MTTTHKGALALVSAMGAAVGSALVREPWDIAAVAFAAIIGAASVLFFAVAWTTHRLR